MIRTFVPWLLAAVALALNSFPARACNPAFAPAVAYADPSYGFGYGVSYPMPSFGYSYAPAYSPFVTRQFLTFDAFGRPIFSPTVFNADLAVRVNPLPVSSPSVTVVGGRSRVFLFR